MDSQQIFSDESPELSDDEDISHFENGDERHVLRLVPGDIFRVPLMWLIGESQVFLKIRKVKDNQNEPDTINVFD